MEGRASTTSEEDYNWDISEAADSIDEHDIDSTSEFSHADATNIAKFLESSSACLKREILELLVRKHYQIFGKDGFRYLRTRPAEQQPGCEPRPEGQGDAGIGFSHCFAVWLKEKKKSATEADSIERWREIYQELFPNEKIPSPFVSSEDAGTSAGIHSEEDKTQLEDQHALQYHTVQALFQDQVNAVVDTTMNNLEPTLRGLLEQVPNTNLDGLDLGLLNWPEIMPLDTLQPNYLNEARPDYAQVGDSGNHRHERSFASNQTEQAPQCAGLGTRQYSQPVSDPWRNGPDSPSFDSAYGEGVGIPSSSRLLEEPTGGQAAYQPLNISYLNNQIQTQVQAEVAPLIQSIAALNAMVRQAFSPGTRILPHVSESPDEGTTDGRDLHSRRSADSTMGNNARPSAEQPGRVPGPGSSELRGEMGETPGRQNTDSREGGRLHGSQRANPPVLLHPLSELSSMFDN
ncbi:hypothetical protein IFR05_001631 [Cadophora sp. M221]|nr:hypothetical protein IFR05_001631 [Cadophora sp. M221]